jgi:hypothetical protein
LFHLRSAMGRDRAPHPGLAGGRSGEGGCGGLPAPLPVASTKGMNEPQDPTSAEDGSPEGSPAPGMRIVRTPIALVGLEAMAQSMFGNLVEAVVDTERGVMAVGGEIHADEEALLLGEGSPSPVSGASTITGRVRHPSQGNRTRPSRRSSAAGCSRCWSSGPSSISTTCA